MSQGSRRHIRSIRSVDKKGFSRLRLRRPPGIEQIRTDNRLEQSSPSHAPFLGHISAIAACSRTHRTGMSHCPQPPLPLPRILCASQHSLCHIFCPSVVQACYTRLARPPADYFVWSSWTQCSYGARRDRLWLHRFSRTLSRFQARCESRCPTLLRRGRRQLTIDAAARIAKAGTQVIIPYRDEDEKRHLKVTGDLGQIVAMVRSPFRRFLFIIK